MGFTLTLTLLTLTLTLVGVELGDRLDRAVGALGLAEAEEGGLRHVAQAVVDAELEDAGDPLLVRVRLRVRGRGRGRGRDRGRGRVRLRLRVRLRVRARDPLLLQPGEHAALAQRHVHAPVAW